MKPDELQAVGEKIVALLKEQGMEDAQVGILDKAAPLTLDGAPGQEKLVMVFRPKELNPDPSVDMKAIQAAISKVPVIAERFNGLQHKVHAEGEMADPRMASKAADFKLSGPNEEHPMYRLRLKLPEGMTAEDIYKSILETQIPAKAEPAVTEPAVTVSGEPVITISANTDAAGVGATDTPSAANMEAVPETTPPAQPTALQIAMERAKRGERAPISAGRG